MTDTKAGELRPEVEEALREALGCDNADCGEPLCGEQRKRLRALIELGVRLGVEAHKAEAKRVIDEHWERASKDRQWGAAQQCALSEAGERINAVAITVASVLEGK